MQLHIINRYLDRLGTGLKLNDKQVNAVYKKLTKWLTESIQLIKNSFLKPKKQKGYIELITERVKVFG